MHFSIAISSKLPSLTSKNSNTYKIQLHSLQRPHYSHSPTALLAPSPITYPVQTPLHHLQGPQKPCPSYLTWPSPPLELDSSPGAPVPQTDQVLWGYVLWNGNSWQTASLWSDYKQDVMSGRLIYEEPKRKASPASLSAVLSHRLAQLELILPTCCWGPTRCPNDWQQQTRQTAIHLSPSLSPFKPTIFFLMLSHPTSFQNIIHPISSTSFSFLLLINILAYWISPSSELSPLPHLLICLLHRPISSHFSISPDQTRCCASALAASASDKQK